MADDKSKKVSGIGTAYPLARITRSLFAQKTGLTPQPVRDLIRQHGNDRKHLGT
ncbi:hypothetical protein [Mesorhizobium sp. Cs1321R2N1]|uniref:hypothetical protein n=1 Tax=Mesorhizobium sp. Cs1321R2N1 TaxID=3015174 RepID=UPI00301BCC6C